MAQPFVGASYPQSKNMAGLPVNYDPYSIMVKNVPRYLSESHVRHNFMAAPVHGVWACNQNRKFNRSTNISESIEGQFFINFVSQEHASAALQEWNGRYIHDRQISVEPKTLRPGQLQTIPSGRDYDDWLARMYGEQDFQGQVVAQASSRPSTSPVNITVQQTALFQSATLPRASAPSFIPRTQVPDDSEVSASFLSLPNTASSTEVATLLQRRVTVPIPVPGPEDVIAERSSSEPPQLTMASSSGMATRSQRSVMAPIAFRPASLLPSPNIGSFSNITPSSEPLVTAPAPAPVSRPIAFRLSETVRNTPSWLSVSHTGTFTYRPSSTVLEPRRQHPDEPAAPVLSPSTASPSSAASLSRSSNATSSATSPLPSSNTASSSIASSPQSSSTTSSTSHSQDSVLTWVLPGLASPVRMPANWLKTAT